MYLLIDFENTKISLVHFQINQRINIYLQTMNLHVKFVGAREFKEKKKGKILIARSNKTFQPFRLRA